MVGDSSVAFTERVHEANQHLRADSSSSGVQQCALCVFVCVCAFGRAPPGESETSSPPRPRSTSECRTWPAPSLCSWSPRSETGRFQTSWSVAVDLLSGGTRGGEMRSLVVSSLSNQKCYFRGGIISQVGTRSSRSSSSSHSPGSQPYTSLVFWRRTQCESEFPPSATDRSEVPGGSV